jgi:Sigma 54 modulation protein / S30EA ribosomal protein
MLPHLTITFRHLPRTGALESAARELSHRLESVNDRISACHITMEGRSNSKGAIGEYSVKIHLSVPGAEIHADSAHPCDTRHLDARSALRSAYDDARLQLEELPRFHAPLPRPEANLSDYP